MKQQEKRIPIRDISRYAGRTRVYESLDEFYGCTEFMSGLHSIRIQDEVFLDLLWRDDSAETTLVIFNGAGYPSDLKRPGFSVTGVIDRLSKDIPVNALFVHDPTLYLDMGLSLAWYGGGVGLPTQTILPRAIDHLLCRTSTRRLAFFGVSGGGYAALQVSHEFPGSVAIACIPQVVLPEYEDWAIERYYESCWGISKKDFRARSGLARAAFVEDLRRVYSLDVANFPILLLNSTDRHHIDVHAARFVEARSASTPVLVRSWGDGHVGPTPDFYISFFGRLVRSADWSSYDWSGSVDWVTSGAELRRLASQRREGGTYELEGPVDLNHSDLRMDFSGFEHGTLEFTATLDCDGDLGGQDALLVFRGPGGDTVWNSVGVHVKPGFAYSPFAYLATRAGSRDIKLRLRIPEAARVSALEVVPWNPRGQARRVVVRNVRAAFYEDE
ncbi:hypothetical protein [Cellulosimicrobium sp. RS]|uniref:hypothetical protein n=1 Tax=Cellulosimicrobium sp. RS TaxID=3381347 RepID=UPI0038FC24D6